MRIGIDARLTHYSQAGISQYIQRLLVELPRLDPAVDWRVVVSRKEARPPANALRAWTPCHHRLERWALGLELLPRGLDLLHSPDFIPPALGARRFVITVHDLNFVHFPQFLTAESLRYYAGQIEWAVRRADHILADSEKTRSDLLELLGVPPEKVTTVLLAADERFRPGIDPAPALLRYRLDPGYLLCVGTLEPRKNIPALLQAYRVLLDRDRFDAPLVLVGRRGWLADEIFATIKSLHLAEWVRLLEDVRDADTLVQLYNGATVLTTPSFYEGFGLPALEAMACGTPVVVAARGSLPEIVGDAGLLIDPEDPQNLADALARAISDRSLRQGMIERGLAQAARFSWQRTARATLQVYRQVLNWPAGPGRRRPAAEQKPSA